MSNKLKIRSLAVVTAVAAMLLAGCSSSGDETPPASESVEEVESNAPVAEEEEAQPEEEASSGGYQAIYDEYAARLTEECPSLSMTECAELSNEGISEMAEYMLEASGTDGQMATYEEWAGKLQDVYMSSVQ